MTTQPDLSQPGPGGTRAYRVEHRTVYSYGAPMTDGYTVTSLIPRATDVQTVIEAAIVLDPPESDRDAYLDGFNNLVNQFGVHESHQVLTITATSVVALRRRETPVDNTSWEQVAGLLAEATGDLAIEAGFFRAPSPFIDLVELGERLRQLAAASFVPGRPIVEAVGALCRQIFAEYAFDANFSSLSTPLGDVLEARRGVCQDFAHLAIGALRSLGLAARYVSGYIETMPPPGEPRLVGADASHAWCSVWTPLAGWVDFDPTNGQLPVNDHITVAWGRDYADVVPVRGVMIGPSTDQTLEVSVDVARQ